MERLNVWAFSLESDKIGNLTSCVISVIKIQIKNEKRLSLFEVQNSRVTKSSYETVTQNDVTLRVTNSKMFTEILLSSY